MNLESNVRVKENRSNNIIKSNIEEGKEKLNFPISFN